MSAWLGWLIAIAGAAVWLGIGFGVVAPAWITSEVEENIRDFPHSARDPESVARWRREARGLCWGPALVWPLSIVRLLGMWSASRSELTDHELRARAAEMQRRIADLEREAGIR